QPAVVFGTRLMPGLFDCAFELAGPGMLRWMMIMFTAHGLGILPLHEPLGKMQGFGLGFPFGLPAPANRLGATSKRVCHSEEHKRRGTCCLPTASILHADSRFLYPRFASRRND